MSCAVDSENAIPKPTDLKNRERVNFVIDSLLMDKLRKLSATSNVPMSRMVDTAIMQTYKLDKDNVFSNIFLINHSIKIYIYKGADSDEINYICKILNGFDKKFILGDCLLTKRNQKRIIGTLLSFFLDDGEDEILTQCIQYLRKNMINFLTYVDDSPISQ